MKTTSRLLLLALLAGASGCQLRRYDLSANRSVTTGTAGVQVVVIAASAGLLRIEGAGSAADEITASGTAHAGTTAALAGVTLRTRRSRDTVFVTASVPAEQHPVGESASLDVNVRVPSSMRIVVTDPSGETIVRNVGPFSIMHGSGGLDIDGVTGSLAIDDGPGDMVVANVRGDVTITDGTGAIYLSNIHGSVSIPTDGAGEVQVAGVTGDVTVGSKESGEVSASGVGGDLMVRATGSGSIEYRDVKGRVTLPAERHRP